MLRLRRFLMHHFTCVFNGNANIILINSEFQKQRQVKISVKRRHIDVILTQCILKTLLIRTVRKFGIQQGPGILKYNYRFHYNAVYIFTVTVWQSKSPQKYFGILYLEFSFTAVQRLRRLFLSFFFLLVFVV